MLENLPLTIDQQFHDLDCKYILPSNLPSLDSTLFPQTPYEQRSKSRGVSPEEPINTLPPLCVLAWYGATFDLLHKVILSHPRLLTPKVVLYCLKYKDFEMVAYFTEELRILEKYQPKAILFRNSALIAQAFNDRSSLRLIHYLSYVINKLNPSTIHGQNHPLLM